MSTLIAIAVVEHEDHFLIAQRPAGVPLAGLWEFPGGKIEPGETPEVAAVRECREETGITVEPLFRYPTHVQDYDHDRVELHFIACRPSPHEDQPTAGRYRWVSRGQLSRYEFPEGNRGLLAALAEGENRSR
jgi:8-oxo-dGTP diphosphatase